MAEEKINTSPKSTTAVVTNKQSRGVVLLVISFLIILGINSLLPMIQGDAHYTADAVSVTYGEYITMREENTHYRLAWISEQKMVLYIQNYIVSHPELSAEEQMLIAVPDTFPVKVNTKFFFEYPFWYISTLTSLGSSVILFYTLFYYFITVAKFKYKKYLDIAKQVDDMADKHLDPTTFEPWMDDVFNPNRKIRQHRANVKSAMGVLEHKTPYKIRRKLCPYFDALRFYKASPGLKDPKEVLDSIGGLKWRERHYLNKKEKYLALLEEAYIKEYAVNGKVRFFKHIYPMFVYNGNNKVDNGGAIDSYSNIKDDAARISQDATSKVTISLTITVLFAVLLTVTAIASYEQSTFWVIINAVAKIAPLLIQVPMAIRYSNTFMDTQLISNMISRRSIGLQYLADLHKEIPHELVRAVEKEGDTNAKTN